jgi:ABC-2 type transport system ATP-binding protein
MSPSAPPPALETRGLTKDFVVGWRGTRLRAVDALDLQVPAGEIFGLLGPNGSGKSTAIKLLLGLLEPTAGTSAIAGVSSQRIAARSSVGYLPVMPDFYRHLTGRALIRFYAQLCGVPRRTLAAQADDALAWVGLSTDADRRVGTYSKGMLQRLGLAQALVHDPSVVILDEPTAGVDPLGAAEMGALIRGLKTRGKTVLITSHLLAHMEELCDRVAILHRGRKIAEDTVANLTQAAGDAGWRIEGLAAPHVAELQTWLTARGGRLAAAEPARVPLDEVFRRHVAAHEERTP